MPPTGEGKASAILEPVWSDADEPGRSLARRLLDENLIVAIPDLVCSGERAAPELPQLTAGGWLGRPLLGRRVSEALRLVDLLDGRQEVDSQRLAVAGIGSGGATALHAMALDRRLRVGVSGGMLASNADRVVALAASGWQELPECLHLMVPGLAALSTRRGTVRVWPATATLACRGRVCSRPCSSRRSARVSSRRPASSWSATCGRSTSSRCLPGPLPCRWRALPLYSLTL
jgi:hypothetical protein